MTVGEQAAEVRLGGGGFEFLIVCSSPLRALARFELFEQLQFALGFKHFDALRHDLLSQLRATLFERCGAALDVGLEMRERDVVVTGG